MNTVSSASSSRPSLLAISSLNPVISPAIPLLIVLVGIPPLNDVVFKSGVGPTTLLLVIGAPTWAVILLTSVLCWI